MGLTKKGTIMKIDNARPSNTAAQQPIIKDKNQAFEKWINNPTHQSDGGEYYWLHQDQLQQSALDFSAKPYTGQKERTLILTKDEPAFTDKQSAIEDSFELTINHHTLVAATNPDALTIHIEPLSPKQYLNSKLHSNSNAIIAFCPPSKDQTVSRNKAIDATALPTLTAPDFKNHRLFIHKKEAELTLNVPTLKSNDLKQLTQAIKKIITQQGLLLKSLIINGVKP